MVILQMVCGVFLKFLKNAIGSYVVECVRRRQE